MNTQDFFINEGILEYFSEDKTYNPDVDEVNFIKGEYVFNEKFEFRFHGEDLFEIEDDWCDQSIINFTLNMLEHYKYSVLGFKPTYAHEVQMLAELCNLAAKECNPQFYKIKHHLCAIAIKRGAEWCGESGIYSLYTHQAGVSSFHDPRNELKNLIKELYIAPCDDIEWSEVYRQDKANEIIKSYLEGSIFHKFMAYITRPGQTMSKMPKKFVQHIEQILEAA